MPIYDPGGSGRCGWLCLDKALGFDSEKYLSVYLLQIDPAVLQQVVRDLYKHDATMRHWMVRNRPNRLPALLRSKPAKLEFNSAWALALLHTPFFEENRINILFITDDGERMRYRLPRRNRWIILLGGEGHWRLQIN
jgi:hypothetical protein